MPNIRSDGARSTAAPITTAMTVAAVDTMRSSARRPRTGDHRRENQHGTGHGPAAHVAHVRREPCVEGERVQREEPRRLRESEHRESCGEAPPSDGGEGGDPQREIERDLERRQKRDRALRIVQRPTASCETARV